MSNHAERPCLQGFRMYADKRSFVRTTSVESFVELLCIRLGCQESFNQTSLRLSTNVQTIHSQLFADPMRKRQLTENYKKKRNKSKAKWITDISVVSQQLVSQEYSRLRSAKASSYLIRARGHQNCIATPKLKISSDQDR